MLVAGIKGSAKNVFYSLQDEILKERCFSKYLYIEHNLENGKIITLSHKETLTLASGKIDIIPACDPAWW